MEFFTIKRKNTVLVNLKRCHSHKVYNVTYEVTNLENNHSCCCGVLFTDRLILGVGVCIARQYATSLGMARSSVVTDRIHVRRPSVHCHSVDPVLQILHIQPITVLLLSCDHRNSQRHRVERYHTSSLTHNPLFHDRHLIGSCCFNASSPKRSFSFEKDLTIHSPISSLISELLQPLHMIHAVSSKNITWRNRRYNVIANDRFESCE